MSQRVRSDREIAGRLGRMLFRGTSLFWLCLLLPASPSWAKGQVEHITPLLLLSSKAIFSQLSSPANASSSPSRSGRAVLLDTQPVPPRQGLAESAPAFAQGAIAPLRQGDRVSLNGRLLTVPWQQWQAGASVRTGISDAQLRQNFGVELLSSRALRQQPVQWFSNPSDTPLVLASLLGGGYRYLDITDLARQVGWQLQVTGDTLQITSGAARVQEIRQGHQSWGWRIVVDLDRPTFWQASDRRTEGVITLDAAIDPALVERFSAPPPEQMQGEEDAAPISVGAQEEAKPVIRLETEKNQTTIRVDIPAGKHLQVFSLPDPNRLVIDLRPDALVEKEIHWAPGIRWHQRYVRLDDSQFPVVWLEINPKVDGLSLRPIWSNPLTQVGTASLLQTGRLWQASAAINAGFFNRNNELPLGAIRRDGHWLSGPILNRGAIAWNDRGQVKIGRLRLTETLVTDTGTRLPVLFLNSGYVRAGLARYTRAWGATYTPLTDNEVLFVVQNGQITSQLPGGKANQGSFPIPADGYLLTLRAGGGATQSLRVGMQVRLEGGTVPSEFESYPHILGAGPVLLQNRQVVVDALAEQFSDAFARQSAVRSAIGTTAAGTLIVATFHDRIGGKGPSLSETAQLMQLLGATDALNLDGGSSTGLYLGGQLLDRSPYTAARVHNGLGIFFNSP